MAYDRTNPPALVQQLLAGGVAGRTFTYVSSDDVALIVAPGYFSDGHGLGMREGDTVLWHNPEMGLWHQAILIVQDVTFADPIWTVTVAVKEIVEDEVPLGGAVAPADFIAVFNNGRMERRQISDFLIDLSAVGLVASFATYAIAVAHTPLVAPAFIEIEGYYAAGDGGKSVWKLEASEPTHPLKFSIALANGGGTKWYSLGEKIVNARAVGAKGDGVTSDSAVLNNIATAVEMDFYKVVYFPTGGYVHDTTTYFDINGAADGVTIYGDGMDLSQILLKPGTSNRPFIIRNTTGVILRDIGFVSTATIIANCVDLGNVNDVVVERCRFQDSTFYGLGIYQDPIDLTEEACNNVIVRFCEFIGVGIFGLEQFPKVLSDHTEIHNNYFENCGRNHAAIPGQDPASMKPGSGYKSVRVYNNFVNGAANGGIWMGLNQDADFFGNELWDCAGYAIAYNIDDHPMFPGDNGQKIQRIHDNVIGYRDGFVNTDASISLAAGLTINGPITVERNFILGGMADHSLRIQTVEAMVNLTIRDNTWWIREGDDLAFPIYMSDASGSAPSKPRIVNNRIINKDLTKTAMAMVLDGVDAPYIIGNYLENMGNQAISLTNCPNAIIERNEINGYNVANTSSVGAINIADTNAVAYVIQDNILRETADSHGKALINAGADPTLYVTGNDVPFNMTITVNGTPSIYALSAVPFAQYGRKRMFYGTAAPASGTFTKGDIVFNTEPAAAGTIGWVCTAAGTPGTWKTFGTIAA